MEAVKDFFEEGNVASNEYGVSSQRKPNRPTKVILATLHNFFTLKQESCLRLELHFNWQLATVNCFQKF